jgi:hypothetical protein
MRSSSATVDVYASRYRRGPRSSARRSTGRPYLITIEVVGTPGRETIALDEFVVGD